MDFKSALFFDPEIPLYEAAAVLRLLDKVADFEKAAEVIAGQKKFYTKHSLILSILKDQYAEKEEENPFKKARITIAKTKRESEIKKAFASEDWKKIQHVKKIFQGDYI